MNPPRKRSPGQYVIHLVCYLPSGGRIDIETTLPHEDALAAIDGFIKGAGAKPVAEQLSKPGKP
jgi:hypothetical protein